METKFVLAVVAGAIILYAQLLLSEDATAPASRAQAKAEDQDAEGVGPAGQGSPGDEASQLAKTGAQSQAKTLAEAPGLKDERGKETVSAPMSRAQRMAQTRGLVQAGKLAPGGQGQDAPKR
jgi:hypothetical protein